MKLEGFEAFITVGGQRLDEFASTENETSRKAECWIASEANAEFAIQWTTEYGWRTSVGWVYIDGKSLAGSQIHGGTGKLDASIDRVPVSAAVDRLLVFSTFETTDDDADLINAPHDLNRLGEVELIIWEAEMGHNSENPHYASVDDEIKVHERSKKCGAHRTRLGKESDRTFKTFTTWTKVQPEPLATFLFRYRPLGMLQANDIAPQSAPPSVPTGTGAGSVEQEPESTSSHASGAPLSSSIQVPPTIKKEKRKVKTGNHDIIDVSDDDDEIRSLENKLNALRALKRKKRRTDNGPVKKAKRELVVPSLPNASSTDIIEIDSD